MVFLFPGILFRKGFFSGKFSKHFDYGNAFERIVWAIIFSFICLILFSTLNIYFGEYPERLFVSLKCVNYKTIISNFKSIYSNESPSVFDNKTHLLGITVLFLMLYVFSFLLGLICHFLVTFFEFDRRFSVFRYQNNWNYILGSSKRSNADHKFKSVYYTRLEVLTKDKILFTGRLHDTVTDKDNKIEAITIFDAYKYVKLKKETDQEKIDKIKKIISSSSNNNKLIHHIEDQWSYTYTKKIPGNVFTIFLSQIDNIAINYIQISNFLNTLQRYFIHIGQFVLVFSIFFSLFDLFYLNLEYFQMKSPLKTIISHLYAPITILIVFNALNKIFFHREEGKKYWNSFVSNILLILLSNLIYLYTYMNMSILWVIGLTFITFVLFAISVSSTEEVSPTSSLEKKKM